MTNLKAVIFNGGRGRRLLSITKKPTPKGYLFFNGKPLINYQLVSLKKAGLKEVIIVLRSQKNKKEFETFQKQGLVPKDISYQIYITRHQETISPYLIFDLPEFFSFLKNRDILCLHSDNIFWSSDIKNFLQKIENLENSSLVSLPQDYNLENLPFKVNKNRVSNLGLVEKFGRLGNFTGLAYFRNEDLLKMKDLAGTTKYFVSQNKFISKIIKEKAIINLHWLKFFINMNEIEDYLRVKDVLTANPQFMLN